MKKKKNAWIIAIIVVFVLLFAAACGYLVFKTVNTDSSDDNYKKIASSYAADITETTEGTTQNSTEITAPSTVNTQLADNPVDIPELAAQNPDIYSWIYIPDTNINYPVLQSGEADNFYLDHDIYKNYSFPGAIYSQSCNSREWDDRVTVLYGHNMLNGSMFANLHKFEDTDFFNSHKYIYIYTENRKLTYEVVSAFVYDDRHIMNSFNFSDDAVFQSWLDEAKSPRSIYSNVNSEVNLDLNSKMLVLSTCLDSGDGRYLVQGVLINDEQTK